VKWLLIACAALMGGCGGQATFIDLEITLADGAPAPSTLAVSLFDEYGARLEGVATKNAALPRLVHIDASTFDDRRHELRLVVRGGPSLVVGSTRVSPPPGSTVSAKIELSAGAADRDGDGVPDAIDGCPDAADASQRDADGDGRGDVCSVPPDMGAPDLDPDAMTDAAPTDAAPDLTTSTTAEMPPPDLLPPPDLAPIPIVFRSASNNDLSGSSSHTLTRPPSVVAGDVLIAMLAIGYTGDPNPTITPPNGWTLIRRLDRTESVAFALYWRLATGSEPASYTFTTNNQPHGVGLMLAYSGVHPTMPVVTDSGMLVNSSGSQYSTPSIMPAVPNTVLVATFTGYGDAGDGTWSVPAGATGRSAQDDGSNRSARMFDRPAGAGTNVFTSSVSPTQDYALMHVMALRPAQ
jgi:hypothetical protein